MSAQNALIVGITDNVLKSNQVHQVPTCSIIRFEHCRKSIFKKYYKILKCLFTI